jgi:hypothetical protein
VTASTDKGSDQPAPRGEGDEEYRDDQEFEDDLKELVERLVRRSRPRRPRPEEEAEPEAEAVLPEPAPEEPQDAEAQAVPPKATGAPEAEDTKAQPEPWRRVAIALAAVAALLLVATATLAVLLVRSATSTDARQKVAERAGFIATSLYNYDYGHVDAFLKRQTSLMTASLAASVKQTQPTLASVITDSKVAYSSRVTQVFVSDVHGSRATAIVVMNSKVNTNKGTANVTDWYVQIQLAEQKGQWLVASAPVSLAQGGQVDTDPKGNPIPPTPAPSATPSH